jgi:uncharacterized protein YgiM (DUF1202 family)
LTINYLSILNLISLTRLLCLIAFSTLFTHWVKADSVAQIILKKRAAVTVSNIRLYADSTYAKSTDINFTEGELFEIIGETVREHFDNSQNQTFKWYKVRSLSGQTGWIFGDNIAIVLPERFVENSLKPYYKKEAHFDNGFEKSIVWVAAVEGHDDKHKGSAFFNPAYKEFYLVVTNERGKSSLINYANVNESVKKDVQSVHFQDVTDNGIDDIVIETTTTPVGKSIDERVLEIYSFKAGTLVKIFEERMTLTWDDDVPSPAYSKFVEIEGPVIRIASIDYIFCEKYSLGLPTDNHPKNPERCLEYATTSYVWDKINRVFKPLYPESRTVLTAISKSSIVLKKTPSTSSSSSPIIQPTDRLQVIKHLEEVVTEKGVKKVRNWFYVKHPSGTFGYVAATDLVFKNTEYTTVLKTYYEKPPFEKTEWKPETPFVKVIMPLNQVKSPIVNVKSGN